jgi:hypothetical protein
LNLNNRKWEVWVVWSLLQLFRALGRCSPWVLLARSINWRQASNLGGLLGELFFSISERGKETWRTRLEPLFRHRKFSIRSGWMFFSCKMWSIGTDSSTTPFPIPVFQRVQRKYFLPKSYPMKFLQKSHVPNGALAFLFVLFRSLVQECATLGEGITRLQVCQSCNIDSRWTVTRV